MKKADGWEKRRGQGVEDSRGQRSEGVKDSRIQGVKWFTWNFFKTKEARGQKGKGSREKNRGLEGWQKTEVRRQKSEDRRQETEDRRQKTEVRSQKTEGWRAGGLAKHQKRKGSRIRGFKGSSGSLGIFFKTTEAQVQGVKCGCLSQSQQRTQRKMR